MADKHLQAIIREYPGVVVAVAPAEAAHWQVLLWEYDSADTEMRYDFNSIDAACAFAEREFALTRGDWIQGERCGSPLDIAAIVRHLYRRRLTRREAAAVAYLAYHYECLDERGLFIWPGSGRYATSYRVVAYDVLDTLDWDHGYGSFATASYDFVATAVESDADETPEFQAIWAAVQHAGGVKAWRRLEIGRTLPPFAVSADGPLAATARAAAAQAVEWNCWQTWYVARALGLEQDAHLIPVRRVWSDAATFEVANIGDGCHVILTRRQDDATEYFLTTVGGELRGAAYRAGDTSPVEPIAPERALAAFDRETRHWREWPNDPPR